ncbi:AAA family ATPase [Rhizobium sp. B230/85]|uniref:AAA family ATPase n=1 Tax=unclassified Rhizobium TaxID=2613769 RepID=UPI001ADCDFAD|nr:MULTISPECIES: AAA family ATPase [unclassified Rhizobium]MBO9134198.1 AAA family ATPase [Rhizobium sp. B209b/85]QXZ96674.1 AAA family ATPase [Rhizobium sp. B230/85]
MSGALVSEGVPKPPLKGITAAQLLQRNFPPREFAIDPWLRTGESALIWAATGVGKTWLTLSLALAMAGGGRVWEWAAPKPRKVLILDGEMNVQDLQERINHLIGSGAVDGLDRQAMGANLLLMPRQFQDPRAQFYDITDAASQERILAEMENSGAEVIIIDNLTTCADGLADENDATAFRSIMGFLLMMKQAGKTAIVVHHANKSGKDARGSTALEATFEVKLGLERPPVEKPGEASFITQFGKFRGRGNDSIRPRVWTLREAGWDVQDDTGSNDERVLNAVKSLKFVNQLQVAKALGMSQGSVSKALKRCVILNTAKQDEIDRLFINARSLSGGAQDPAEQEDTLVTKEAANDF